MFRMTANIKIGLWEFGFASVEIVQDINELSDTCIIEIPRKLRWADASIYKGADAIIKRGQEVVVSLGYDFANEVLFRGYVRTIRVGDKAVIECDDSMFLLKLPAAQKKAMSWPNTTLAQVMAYSLPENVEHVIQDIKLGAFSMPKAFTTAQLLSVLCSDDQYNLTAGFRLVDGRPVLFVGAATTKFATVAKKVLFSFNFVPIENNQLKYVNAADRRIKVKAISIQKNNKKLHTTPPEIGDVDGELRTVYQYDTDVAALTAFANAELAKFKADGYSGSFKAFGVPVCRKGDQLNLRDNPLGDHAQLQEIAKKIVTTFGTDGYWQEITIL